MNKLKNPHILPRIFALIAIFLAFSLVADDAADAARRPQRPPPRGRAVKSAACVENAPGIAQLLANTQKKSANEIGRAHV